MSSESDRWSAMRRLVFRLTFCYFALYLALTWSIDHLDLQSEFGFAPGGGLVVRAYARVWPPVVIWIARHVFHVRHPVTYFPGGNSDGIFGYVQVATIAALAIGAAIGWTVLQRRRSPNDSLRGLLSVCLRYALGFTMLDYGTVKVIPVQFFGLPSLVTLVRPYGDFTSFGVLWNFMGSSTAYTMFTGSVEVLAGSLLLFRRTTTLGALLAVGALVNVGALDFAYGVPEKLDVIHLLLMAIVLLAGDFSRLANVFLLNRPVPAIPGTIAAGTSRLRGWAGIAKAAVLVYMAVASPLVAIRLRDSYGPRPPLYGIYDVEAFTLGDKVLAPLTTDTTRWRRVVFESESDTFIEMMDDSWHHYETAYEPSVNTVTLRISRDQTRNALGYSRPDAGHLVLRGAFRAADVAVTLKRVDESQMTLLKERFRWINGQP